MTHFPSHKRDAFLRMLDDWRNGDGTPPLTVSVEVNYEPQAVPLDDFLRDFLGCDDSLPREYVEAVDALGAPNPDPHVMATVAMTYSAAAHRLLIEVQGFALFTNDGEDTLASLVEREAVFVEHRRKEVARLRRQKRRVEPHLRKLAEREPSTFRAVAARLESGEYRAEPTDAQLTVTFTLYDGESYIGEVEVYSEQPNIDIGPVIEEAIASGDAFVNGDLKLRSPIAAVEPA
jgi:hypothetical protein